MDTETKQSSGQAGQDATPDVMTLLGQTSLPANVCGWLSCLRKSGMSLTYSMQKRHIPDMDQPQSAQGGQNGGQNGGQTGGQTDGQSDGQAQNASSGQGNQQSAGTSDTVTCSGSCSVRYFDLAVGAMLVLTVCGMLKGLRCMKRWF